MQFSVTFLDQGSGREDQTLTTQKSLFACIQASTLSLIFNNFGVIGEAAIGADLITPTEKATLVADYSKLRRRLEFVRFLGRLLQQPTHP